MTDIASGAQGAGQRPRAKKPQGWYSRGQREARSAAREARRTELEQIRGDRERARAAAEARAAPIRITASKLLGQLPDAAAARTKRLVQRTRELRRGRIERKELLASWRHKQEGTPETHQHASRTQQGSLARLHASGAITADQFAWALEIAAVAERIMSDVAVRTASLETRVDVSRRGDEGFFEKLGQVRREMAYSEWRTRVARELGPIGAVLDMVVGEPIGLTAVAMRHRMHKRRVRNLLIDALDLWPNVLGEKCKEIDAASVLAAAAGLS